MRLVPALTWMMEGGSDAALDARLVPLLEAIAATGSLAAAVAERRMSYRSAWGLLRDAERDFGAALVQLQRGRGAQLADMGVRLLRAPAGPTRYRRGMAAALRCIAAPRANL